MGHVYVSQASDYELLADDGVPHYSEAASPETALPPKRLPTL